MMTSITQILVSSLIAIGVMVAIQPAFNDINAALVAALNPDSIIELTVQK